MNLALKSWPLTSLWSTFFLYWPNITLSFNLTLYHVIEKKNYSVTALPFAKLSSSWNFTQEFYQLLWWSQWVEPRSGANSWVQTLREAISKHSGKLPTSRTVTAHNAMFASIKHLGIFIYTATHAAQDQTQWGTGGEQGQPHGVMAGDWTPSTVLCWREGNK